MFNIRKKSIFNDWSVSENQFNIVLYIKIHVYIVKNVCCWKKNHGVDLQYKIIITKYQNIAINSFSIKHEHAHKVVVKNGGCITSHNKRGEQAFLY
jgi:hypothetical protein